jgi:hypothetical protein
MKKRNAISFLAAFLTICLSAAAWAGSHGQPAGQKVGILLVAFGSSEASAQVSFENIAKKTKAGIQCVPILKGTAEYDVFVDMWVDHLRGPLSHLD